VNCVCGMSRMYPVTSVTKIADGDGGGGPGIPTRAFRSAEYSVPNNIIFLPWEIFISTCAFISSFYFFYFILFHFTSGVPIHSAPIPFRFFGELEGSVGMREDGIAENVVCGGL